MFSERLSFVIPEFYDLRTTCHAHGWKNLAPFTWDEANHSLLFSVFAGSIPVDIQASQSGTIVNAHVKSAHGLGIKHVTDLNMMVFRCLGLGIETVQLLRVAEKVGPDYVRLIRSGSGRLLRSPTLWEDAAKTLFTTNCSWALTKKMCESFCSDVFSIPAPSGKYPFPGPTRVSSFSKGELKQLAPVGYRSEYLVGLAELFSKDPSLCDIENKGFDYKSAGAVIRKIRGFGDYAVAHMLVLTGYYDDIPIDTVVVDYLKRNHGARKPKSFIDRTYKRWGKYKWWGLKLEKMLRQQNWLGD